MEKYINIVPVICAFNESELDKVEILNDKPFKVKTKTTFCISIFSSIYCDNDVKIKLLLRHIDKGIGLDMGTVDIVKKTSEEFQLYHNTYFFNVETIFPETGRYVLEIFKVNEDNEEDIESQQPIAATILEVI